MLGRKQWQGGYCSRCLFSSLSALAVSVRTVFHRSLLCEILARGGRGRSALVWWQRWQLISPRIKQEIFDLSVMIKHLFPTASSRDVHFSTDVLWFSSWRYQEGWGMCSTKAPIDIVGWCDTGSCAPHFGSAHLPFFCHLFSYPVQTIQTLFATRKSWK